MLTYYGSLCRGPCWVKERVRLWGKEQCCLQRNKPQVVGKALSPKSFWVAMAVALTTSTWRFKTCQTRPSKVPSDPPPGVRTQGQLCFPQGAKNLSMHLQGPWTCLQSRSYSYYYSKRSGRLLNHLNCGLLCSLVARHHPWACTTLIRANS